MFFKIFRIKLIHIIHIVSFIWELVCKKNFNISDRLQKTCSFKNYLKKIRFIFSTKYDIKVFPVILIYRRLLSKHTIHYIRLRIDKSQKNFVGEFKNFPIRSYTKISSIPYRNIILPTNFMKFFDFCVHIDFEIFFEEK